MNDSQLLNTALMMFGQPDIQVCQDPKDKRRFTVELTFRKSKRK